MWTLPFSFLKVWNIFDLYVKRCWVNFTNCPCQLSDGLRCWHSEMAKSMEEILNNRSYGKTKILDLICSKMCKFPWTTSPFYNTLQGQLKFYPLSTRMCHIVITTTRCEDPTSSTIIRAICLCFKYIFWHDCHENAGEITSCKKIKLPLFRRISDDRHLYFM
jgi:hypothetical protein